MKLPIWTLLAVLILSCNPKSPGEDTTANAVEINVEEYEKKGFEIFQENPREAIQIFKQVAVKYEKDENLKKAGITNLNIANIYDERLEETDSAIIFSKKALTIWRTQNDTLQMANLYKYIGLLKGRLGETEEAKADIQQAIGMYEKAGFAQGVAVSEINLAEVHLNTQNYKESEALFIKSKAFWKGNGDLSRVFTNNILGIRIYTEMEAPEKAGELIKENQEIMDQVELDGFIIDQFNELIHSI